MLSTKYEDIQVEVTQMCDTLLKELQENLEYADKCRKANEEWEKKVMKSHTLQSVLLLYVFQIERQQTQHTHISYIRVGIYISIIWQWTCLLWFVVDMLKYAIVTDWCVAVVVVSICV